jgi:hypothetical protein
MASRALNLDPTRATVSTPDRSAGPAITHVEIAGRAYELWVERGRPIGSEQEDWFKAEKELKTRYGAKAG